MSGFQNCDQLSFSLVEINVTLPKIVAVEYGGFELNESFDSKGGLGLIYKVRHITSKAFYALKCPLHTSFIDNMRKELDILSTLRHPFIIDIVIMQISVMEQGNRRIPFFIMPWAHGSSLDTWCTQNENERFDILHEALGDNEGNISISDKNLENDEYASRVFDIILQVANGLVHAHNNGVIHSDIKPKNILVMKVDNVSPYLNIKICDFNISASSSEDFNIKQCTGTPGYRSPEQVILWESRSDQSSKQEALTDKSDSWSLGLVILGLLTKCKLFEYINSIGDSFYFNQSEYMDKIKDGSQWLSNVRTPSIESSVESLIAGCLTVDRSMRWSMKTIREKCNEIAGQGLHRLKELEKMISDSDSDSRLKIAKLTAQANFAQYIENDYKKSVFFFEKALDVDKSDVNTLCSYLDLIVTHRRDIDTVAQRLFDRKDIASVLNHLRSSVINKKGEYSHDEIKNIESLVRVCMQLSPIIDEQILVKALAYMKVLEDYCKQIIRESSTMRTLGYDISSHSDSDLTSIISERFYSVYTPSDMSKSLLLKLGHVQSSDSSSYVDIQDDWYSDSLLDISGDRIPAAFDPMSIKQIFSTHQRDKENMAGLNFSNWDMTSLQSIFMHWYYRDPSSNTLVKSDFHSVDSPVPPSGFDDIKQAIKTFLVGCDLDDRNVSDCDKFNAITTFSQLKKSGHFFSSIKRISCSDFISLLVHVMNHIFHKFPQSERKEFSEISMKELQAFEDVLGVFFQLVPLRSRSIVDRLEEVARIAVLDEAEGFSRREIDAIKSILSVVSRLTPTSHQVVEAGLIKAEVDKYSSFLEKYSVNSKAIYDKQLLKAISYITLMEDYCKQIIRESDTIRALGYSIESDRDGRLTSIIKREFYSSSDNLFLRWGQAQSISSYVAIEGEYYSDSLLTADGERVPVTFDPMSTQKVFDVHRSDMKNVRGHNFSHWDINTLKTVFMFLYYKDPIDGKFKKCDFRSSAMPVPPGGYDDIKLALKTFPIACDLDRKEVSGIAKFRAIVDFSRKKSSGEFSAINRISNEDFVSILVHVRSHIILVGERQEGLSEEEISDIANVIKVLFDLNPISDQSIIARFKEKSSMVVDEDEAYRGSQILYKSTAEGRLYGWIGEVYSSIKQKGAEDFDPELFYPSLNFNGDREFFQFGESENYRGIVIGISRVRSKTYGLPEYNSVRLGIPEGHRVRVGSRGIGDDILPDGSYFGNSEKSVHSLAIEDPYILPHANYNNNDNWSFDIFYDGTEWKVRVADGAEGYYQGILQTIESINSNEELSEYEKKERVGRERLKLVELVCEKNGILDFYVLGSEPVRFPTKLRVGIHHFKLLGFSKYLYNRLSSCIH